VHAALAHIEAAQVELEKACQALSSVIPLASSYVATGKLRDRTHDLWKRVRYTDCGKQLALDEMARKSCDARDAAHKVIPLDDLDFCRTCEHRRERHVNGGCTHNYPGVSCTCVLFVERQFSVPAWLTRGLKRPEGDR
jgi:hypothetical protein